MIYHRKRPILYVDDTVEQRYAMRRILEAEGFVVMEAGTGAEAMAMVNESPALAVVDVRLPDISGYDLTRELKRRHVGMPVLQVSASFSNPELRAAGFSGGADAYIAQPVHPSELVSLIKRMLRISEAEESLRFLATVGPHVSASLSLVEATENIRGAMVPQFADRCFVYLGEFPGHDSTFWPDDSTCTRELRGALERIAQEVTPFLELEGPRARRLLLAPLSAQKKGFGAIAFELDAEREYTGTDLVLAVDLANRVGLAMQNCMLYESEQATRAALIQSEKLATAGRMSAAIAHEINNPLEALTNLIYLLEQSPEASPSLKELASSALAEVTRLAHITRQTLGFYRELRAPSTMDLSQSVRDTLELYTTRLNTRQVDLTLELEDGVTIRGIKGEIRQVISNLLVNALEAMEQKGKMMICTRADGTTATLSIADTGPGVPEGLRARIFEPFFTTKQGTGTGLGLWITQTIIEKHGGQIALESRTPGEGHGTTFTLTFPLVKEGLSQS